MQSLHYSYQQIQNLSPEFRSNFISSLNGFKPVNLVGTTSVKKETNLAIISSVVHIGSNPALFGFFMRPIVITRDTYHNILATKFYTINHVQEHFIPQAHQTSEHFPPEISEFDSCGLREEYIEQFHPPFVKESQIKMGLELSEIITIKSNETILIVGKVQHLLVNKDCLQNNGELRLDKIQGCCMTGNNHYYSPQFINTSL